MTQVQILSSIDELMSSLPVMKSRDQKKSLQGLKESLSTVQQVQCTPQIFDILDACLELNKAPVTEAVLKTLLNWIEWKFLSDCWDTQEPTGKERPFIRLFSVLEKSLSTQKSNAPTYVISVILSIFLSPKWRIRPGADMFHLLRLYEFSYLGLRTLEEQESALKNLHQIINHVFTASKNVQTDKNEDVRLESIRRCVRSSQPTQPTLLCRLLSLSGLLFILTHHPQVFQTLPNTHFFPMSISLKQNILPTALANTGSRVLQAFRYSVSIATRAILLVGVSPSTSSLDLSSPLSMKDEFSSILSVFSFILNQPGVLLSEKRSIVDLFITPLFRMKSDTKKTQQSSKQPPQSLRILSSMFGVFDCEIGEENHVERLLEGLSKIAQDKDSESPDSSADQDSLADSAFLAMVDLTRAVEIWGTSDMFSVAHSSPFSVLSSKNTKALINKAAFLFNMKPSKGIEFLYRNKICKEDPEDLAKFLYNHSSLLSPTTFGDYFSSSDSFVGNVIKAYLSLFNFKGIPLDIAIGSILSTFRISGESQVIFRMMELFGNEYTEQNPGIFPDADVCSVIAYQVVMLHSFAHGKGPIQGKPKKEPVEPRPTELSILPRATFILQGKEGGFDNPEWLDACYTRVLENEIKVFGDDDERVIKALDYQKETMSREEFQKEMEERAEEERALIAKRMIERLRNKVLDQEKERLKQRKSKEKTTDIEHTEENVAVEGEDNDVDELYFSIEERKDNVGDKPNESSPTDKTDDPPSIETSVEPDQTELSPKSEEQSETVKDEPNKPNQQEQQVESTEPAPQQPQKALSTVPDSDLNSDSTDKPRSVDVGNEEVQKPSVSDSFLAIPFLTPQHLSASVEVLCWPFLAMYSRVTENTDSHETVQLCLTSLRKLLHLSCQLKLETERHAIISALIKITGLPHLSLENRNKEKIISSSLQTQKALQLKNVEAIRTLFRAASIDNDGPSFGSSWGSVLLLSSQLHRLHTLSEGMSTREVDMAFTINTESTAYAIHDEEPQTLTRNGMRLDRQSLMNSVFLFKQNNFSFKNEVETLFSTTNRLSPSSLFSFVSGLLSVSKQDMSDANILHQYTGIFASTFLPLSTTPSPLYALQKLQDVLSYNMNRSLEVWDRLFPLVSTHLSQIATKSTNTNMGTLAVVVMRQTVFGLFQRSDLLPATTFISPFDVDNAKLQPFAVEVSQPSESVKTGRILLSPSPSLSSLDMELPSSSPSPAGSTEGQENMTGNVTNRQSMLIKPFEQICASTNTTIASLAVECLSQLISVAGSRLCSGWIVLLNSIKNTLKTTIALSLEQASIKDTKPAQQIEGQAKKLLPHEETLSLLKTAFNLLRKVTLECIPFFVPFGGMTECVAALSVAATPPFFSPNPASATVQNIAHNAVDLLSHLLRAVTGDTPIIAKKKPLEGEEQHSPAEDTFGDMLQSLFALNCVHSHVGQFDESHLVSLVLPILHSLVSVIISNIENEHKDANMFLVLNDKEQQSLNTLSTHTSIRHLAFATLTTYLHEKGRSFSPFFWHICWRGIVNPILADFETYLDMMMPPIDEESNPSKLWEIANSFPFLKSIAFSVKPTARLVPISQPHLNWMGHVMVPMLKSLISLFAANFDFLSFPALPESQHGSLSSTLKGDTHTPSDAPFHIHCPKCGSHVGATTTLGHCELNTSVVDSFLRLIAVSVSIPTRPALSTLSLPILSFLVESLSTLTKEMFTQHTGTRHCSNCDWVEEPKQQSNEQSEECVVSPPIWEHIFALFCTIVSHAIPTQLISWGRPGWGAWKTKPEGSAYSPYHPFLISNKRVRHSLPTLEMTLVTWQSRVLLDMIPTIEASIQSISLHCLSSVDVSPLLSCIRQTVRLTRAFDRDMHLKIPMKALIKDRKTPSLWSLENTYTPFLLNVFFALLKNPHLPEQMRPIIKQNMIGECLTIIASTSVLTSLYQRTPQAGLSKKLIAEILAEKEEEQLKSSPFSAVKGTASTTSGILPKKETKKAEEDASNSANVKKDGKSEDLLPTDTPAVHLAKRPSISTAASPIVSPIQAQPSSSQDKPQPTLPPPVVPLQPQTQTPQRVASPPLEKRDDVKNDSFVVFPEKWELMPVEECVQAELQLLHPLATTPPSSPLSIFLPPRLDESVVAELKKNKTEDELDALLVPVTLFGELPINSTIVLAALHTLGRLKFEEIHELAPVIHPLLFPLLDHPSRPVRLVASALLSTVSAPSKDEVFAAGQWNSQLVIQNVPFSPSLYSDQETAKL
ncbi:putative Brefeldin A-inhibited guanine nucleotide-exchange protein 2 [Blattamonas nauphoetae]|uniref:Brefeldin A-inhibited guanine nucleotide-exchange protein 2 n=1 Tax=Blattamonas nauphoetae TaxID=2049346 RepID=A0ABQ9X0H7_9EUKA|nr:putative Brefeldin A-inhibited guanine nucleotide-exchange protein 2 [Blattamonas nauphoetae]